MSLQEEYEKCKEKKGDNKEEKLSCLFDVLHRVTELQDSINLSAMGTLSTEDSDPRWLSIHVINDANAVILNMSRAGANPDSSWRKPAYNRLYVDEKVENLHSRWQVIKGKLDAIKEGRKVEW